MNMSIFTDLWIFPESQNFDLDNLQKGDGIKLKNPLGEKFWVKFLYKEKDELIGKVDNYLVNKSSYNYQDTVSFKKKDIWQINTNENRKEQYIKAVFLVYKFQEKFGRKPTVEELDLVLLKLN
jgi:hypothetical protein